MLCLLLYICCAAISIATGDNIFVQHNHDNLSPANLSSSNPAPGNFASTYNASNLVTNESWANPNRSSKTEKDGKEPSVAILLLIAFISVSTIVGNTLVILAIGVFRKLKRSSNMFIVSLAAADLIMGGVVMPLGTHYMASGKWLAGQVACDIWTSIDVLSVTASICTLCAISIDRYLAITRPFQYSKRVTRTYWRQIIAAIWIVSGLIAFIPINLGWWKTQNQQDIECYNDPTCCLFLPNKIFAVVSSVVSFYIPLTVTVFAYSFVFKIAIEKRSDIVRNQSFENNSSRCSNKIFILTRREYRGIFTMGIVMGTFVVCWLPFFICNIIQTVCARCISEEAFTIFNWLGYTNSFFNPVIFCHSKEFRRAFKQIIYCRLCKDGYQQTCRARLSESHNKGATRRKVNLLHQLNKLLPDKTGQRQKCGCEKRMRKEDNHSTATVCTTVNNVNATVNNNDCAYCKQQVRKVVSNRCDET